MLRVIGLGLLFLIGAAAPAQASDREPKNVASGAQSGTAVAGAKLWFWGHERTTPVQLAKGWQIAPAPLRGRFSTGLGGEWISPTARLAALTPASRARGEAPTLPWAGQGKSGFRLPATERLSFAVGYRHLEGEDLWRRYGEAGSVDYDSHDFILRAHWRF